ncbi:MAG TPA: hypothetical protein VIN37_10540 [Candidatus Limnocylindria bacterium]
MRWLCALVFALAAGSSALAASGLAVPPHIDPPGTPRFHDHLLAAYRYPLFLLRLKMLSRRPDGPGWTLELPGQLALDAVVLATLAVVIPKLPRPTRRAVASLPAILLRAPQWRPGAPLGPPRASLLAI